jgi:predicted transposase YdaD
MGAMDSPGDYKIPILDLYNQVKGKTLLTSKPVMAIVSAFYPEIGEMDEQVQKILMELVGRHEGRLTAEIFKSLRKLATRINMEWVANEREFKKITKQ